MIRFGLLLVAIFMASLVSPATILFESEAAAQRFEANRDGPTGRRMKRLFEQRTTAEAQRCNLQELEKLISEIEATDDLLAQQQNVIGSDTHHSDREIRTAARRRYAEISGGSLLLESYKRTLDFNCNPSRLANRIIDYKNDCKPAEAARLIAKLEGIVAQHSTRVDAVKAAGRRSTVPLAEVQAKLQSAKTQLDRAKVYERSKCEEPGEHGGIENGEIVELEEIGEPAPQTAGVTDEEVAELRTASERSAWLLGDWVYTEWNGGRSNSVLRFSLQSDGTISAHLVSVTNQMAEKGYQPGMQLLRGIRDTSHQLREDATWTHSAMTGETFSPRDPNREPGQIYGQDEWTQSGVIFVYRETGMLGGSTGFQSNRLNFHRGTLVRPDLTSLDEAIERLSSQVERLDRPGNEFERIDELAGIIDQLRENGRYSQEAREAAAILQVLLERDEAINNPDFRRALGALEARQASEEEMRELASFLLEQAAHLARPIARNDYDSLSAAQLLLIARNSSQLLDDYGNPSGAYANVNASRLTRGLTALHGIATLARDPRDNTGQQLMNGVRDLTEVYAARAGVSPALEIPAQTSAAILQQSAQGFSHASSALREVTNAIQGDSSAIGRALVHAERLQQTISSEGYFNAVKSAVTDRIVRRVPFVRSVVDWFE